MSNCPYGSLVEEYASANEDAARWNRERIQRIQQYMQIEEELKLLTRQWRISLRRLLKKLPSQEKALLRAEQLLQRQLELLNQMKGLK